MDNYPLHTLRWLLNCASCIALANKPGLLDCSRAGHLACRPATLPPHRSTVPGASATLMKTTSLLTLVHQAC